MLNQQTTAAMEVFKLQLQIYGAAVPQVAQAVVNELKQQRSYVKLIASENYSSLACQLAMGNWLTDKYAEGIVGKRFYAGCEQVDIIEEHAASLAKELFGAEYAYVQPHSGADANLIAYWAILTTCVEAPMMEKFGATNLLALNEQQWGELRAELGNQRLLAPHIFSGGHLTHGYRYNVSGRMFDCHHYHVNADSGLIDYDQLEEQAGQVRPLILLAGYSAYPRKIDFARMRAIADQVGAVLMVDMAHFAGLVAGKVFGGEFDPVPYADVVTSTTHKTLRGPRGGLILSKQRFAAAVDRGCPLVIGGPLPHVIAAKAVAFHEALQPSFQTYAALIVQNTAALASALSAGGVKVVSGGSENHLLLIDVRPWGITGRQAEMALRECGLTVNRNTLPADSNGPWYTSGLRLGTAAVTTLGMGGEEMELIAALVTEILNNIEPGVIGAAGSGKKSKSKYCLPAAVVTKVKGQVDALLKRFPVYPELDLDALEQVLSPRPSIS